jgi:hypothetical protein
VPSLRATAAVYSTILGLLSCLLAIHTSHNGRQPNNLNNSNILGHDKQDYAWRFGF